MQSIRNGHWIPHLGMETILFDDNNFGVRGKKIHFKFMVFSMKCWVYVRRMPPPRDNILFSTFSLRKLSDLMQFLVSSFRNTHEIFFLMKRRREKKTKNSLCTIHSVHKKTFISCLPAINSYLHISQKFREKICINS